MESQRAESLNTTAESLLVHLYAYRAKECDLKQEQLETGAVLLGLLDEPEGITSQVLTAAGITFETACAKVKEVYSAKARAWGVVDENAGAAERRHVDQVAQLAAQEAMLLGHSYIGTEHVLLGLLRTPDSMGFKALAALGAKPEDIRAQVLEMSRSAGPWKRIPVGVRLHSLEQRKNNPACYQAARRVDEVAVNLNYVADLNESIRGEEGMGTSSGRSAWQEELDSVIQILAQPGPGRSACLVAETGTYPGALIVELLNKIRRGDSGLPAGLRDKQMLELTRLWTLEGTFSNMEEDRAFAFMTKILETMVDEICDAGDVILVLKTPQVEALIGDGSGCLSRGMGKSLLCLGLPPPGPMLAAAMAQVLRPAIAEGKVQCIVITDPGTFSTLEEEDPVLLSCFQLVKLAGLGFNVEETYNALMNSRKKWADDNMFRYADAAILKAAELAVEEGAPGVPPPAEAQRLLKAATYYCQLELLCQYIHNAQHNVPESAKGDWLAERDAEWARQLEHDIPELFRLRFGNEEEARDHLQNLQDRMYEFLFSAFEVAWGGGEPKPPTVTERHVVIAAADQWPSMAFDDAEGRWILQASSDWVLNINSGKPNVLQDMIVAIVRNR